MKRKKIWHAGIVLLALCDILAVVASILIGFSFRFGFFETIPRFYNAQMLLYISVLSLTVILSNVLTRRYSTYWRYFSLQDLFLQFVSAMITAVCMLALDHFGLVEMPPELLMIIPILLFLFMSFERMIPKLFRMGVSRIQPMEKSDPRVPTLVYGAGEAGNYLIENVRLNHARTVKLVGYIDDNERLWGQTVGGFHVFGGGELLEELVRKYAVREVIIAIPSASSDFIRGVFRRCSAMGVVVKRYGTLDDVTSEDFIHAPINTIDFEKLLRRDSVTLNMDAVKRFVSGKTVLVTGGVGSIGSEICRQTLKCGAARVVIVDINENGLFFMKNELDEAGCGGRFEVLLGSVRDRPRMHEIFDKYRPQIVFHAAAHKHVPMMEGNPKEALKNNVLGTINVANESIVSHVEKFILISTDKAVNPTNIMGASKRIAEMVVQVMNSGVATDFAAVRFGNVLGSNGSVVPYFEQQIEQGGPVTVTHREMKRYFMTIPEAVQLVLEAGAMATGGEIFVLDMGKPVYIYDRACDMIRLHGMEPNRDIEIKITGLRPGEKLFEEISLAEEDTTKTANDKIYINKPVAYDEEDFSRRVKALETAMTNGDLDGVFCRVKELVPTFSHDANHALREDVQQERKQTV